jgi:hypothetical protein
LIGKAGEAVVAASLLRLGIAVAYPASAGVVDLLSFREDDPRRVVPIQIKARSGPCYAFQKSWFRLPGIVLVQVWNTRVEPECFIFSTVAQVEDALGQHVRGTSWIERGGYGAPAPNRIDIALMQPHRDRWDRIVDQLPRAGLPAAGPPAAGLRDIPISRAI